MLCQYLGAGGWGAGSGVRDILKATLQPPVVRVPPSCQALSVAWKMVFVGFRLHLVQATRKDHQGTPTWASIGGGAARSSPQLLPP